MVFVLCVGDMVVDNDRFVAEHQKNDGLKTCMLECEARRFLRSGCFDVQCDATYSLKKLRLHLVQ